MNSLLTLLVIYIASTASGDILEVNTIGRTHPRSHVEHPMVVSDIYAANEFFYGKDMAAPVPEGVDPDNVPTLSVKHGLSKTCTDKICNMFYYALSCKALDLGLNKECASYFLGANFACSQFPSPEDFYNAPSVCAVQLASLVALLASGNIVGVMGEYLGQSFQTNSCGRRCYQNYQNAANDFYQTCYTEISSNTTIQATYPVATGIMNFQQFRNQACAVNNNNTNCYVQFTKPTTSTLDTFNMECNYFNLSAGMSTADKTKALAYNNAALLGICSQFASYECCAANDITMYQQAQTNASNIALFPPCLLSYLSNACPKVNLQNYCQNGSIASVATLTAQASIYKVVNGPSQKFLFPNMYNKTSVNQLQGAISGIIQGFFAGGVEPWIFNAHYPFQIQILDYVYYADGTAITPVNANGNPTGTPYFPPGEDYTLADQIRVTYQVTVQNSESYEQASAFLNPIVNNTNFALYLSIVYGGYPPSKPVIATLQQGTTWFAAQPLELPNSAHTTFSQSSVMTGLALTSLCSLLLVWMI